MAFFMRRSLHSAGLTRFSLARIANGSHRTFSSSPSFFKGALPEFLPASSVELTELLNTLNAKILFPEHFTKEQADLAFKKKNAARLETDPIEITIGNVTLPLVHINRVTDIPPRKPLVFKILRASQTPSDWENVLRMMEGFVDAKIPMSVGMLIESIRGLGRAQLPNLILKAVQRAEDTGVLLKSDMVALTVLRQLMLHAKRADFEAAETEKILGMMEQVVEAMDGPAHLGNKPLAPGDPRVDPTLIGLLAYMATIRAKIAGEGDIDGKVEKYTRRLVSALQEDSSSVDDMISKLEEAIALKDTGNTSPMMTSKKAFYVRGFTKNLSPIADALKDSRVILGEKMPQPEVAKRWEERLQKALTEGDAAFEASREAFLKQKPLETKPDDA